MNTNQVEKILVWCESETIETYTKELLKSYGLSNYATVVVAKRQQPLFMIEDAAKELRWFQYSRVPSYQSVWVLFEQDCRPKYDEAIHLAQSIPNVHVIWFNPCLEYWFLIHFADKAVVDQELKINIAERLHETIQSEKPTDLPETEAPNFKVASKECLKLLRSKWLTYAKKSKGYVKNLKYLQPQAIHTMNDCKGPGDFGSNMPEFFKILDSLSLAVKALNNSDKKPLTANSTSENSLTNTAVQRMNTLDISNTVSLSAPYSESSSAEESSSDKVEEKPLKDLENTLQTEPAASPKKEPLLGSYIDWNNHYPTVANGANIKTIEHEAIQGELFLFDDDDQTGSDLKPTTRHCAQMSSAMTSSAITVKNCALSVANRTCSSASQKIAISTTTSAQSSVKSLFLDFQHFAAQERPGFSANVSDVIDSFNRLASLIGEIFPLFKSNNEGKAYFAMMTAAMNPWLKHTPIILLKNIPDATGSAQFAQLLSLLADPIHQPYRCNLLKSAAETVADIKKSEANVSILTAPKRISKNLSWLITAKPHQLMIVCADSFNKENLTAYSIEVKFYIQPCEADKFEQFIDNHLTDLRQCLQQLAFIHNRNYGSDILNATDPIFGLWHQLCRKPLQLVTKHIIGKDFKLPGN